MDDLKENQERIRNHSNPFEVKHPLANLLARQICFETQKTLRETNPNISIQEHEAWSKWAEEMYRMIDLYVGHLDELVAEYQRAVANYSRLHPKPILIEKSPKFSGI